MTKAAAVSVTATCMNNLSYVTSLAAVSISQDVFDLFKKSFMSGHFVFSFVNILPLKLGSVAPTASIQHYCSMRVCVCVTLCVVGGWGAGNRCSLAWHRATLSTLLISV